MAASYNRVILIGNLTRDVEIKYLQNGTAVTDIGLAVNDRYKNQQGEWVDETTFVDVTLWGRTAEVAGEYLSKGSPVFIEGRLKLHQWESEGQKRSKLRVVADKLQLIGAKGGPSGGGEGGGGRPSSRSGGSASRGSGDYSRGGEDGPAPSRSSGPPPMEHGDDDIPF